MASFPPFKKSLFRIITVITIICLLVISCTIPASAYSNSEFPNDNYFPRVNLPCSRPSIDSHTYYAEILTKTPENNFVVHLLVFSFERSLSLENIYCSPMVLDSARIKFSFYCVNPTEKAFISVHAYSFDSSSGKFYTGENYESIDRYTKNDGKIAYEDYTYTFPYTIYGIHYYNFDSITSSSVPEFQVEFVVTYAGEGLVLNYLEYFQYTFTRSLDILNQSISALDVKFQNFSEECIMYLNAQLSHLTNMEIYLEMLTEQNNQMINGPPGSDEEASPPPNVVAPPRDDSTIDDIKEAEKDAVGGKTDEEIKEDIEDTLDFEDKKDEVNGEEIDTSDIEVSHNTFNLVFDFMGGAWNSYFILSLTIAFAAFLIGRRY